MTHRNRAQRRQHIQAALCTQRCEAAGICLVLPGCQDKHRPCAGKKPLPSEQLAAQITNQLPHQQGGQSRTASAVETAASIGIGFLVSLVLQAVLLPLYGHHITLSQNIQITFVFTVASLLRGYAVRRGFNWLQGRKEAA
jgi:hypothetical protein